MGTTGRLLLAAAGVAVAVILFLVLRPGSDETEASPTAEPTTSGKTTTDTETDATTTEPEEPAGPRLIRIDVRSGEPEIERVDVERGERIVLVVRADVADHVHVHGYDLMADVSPGQTARIAFRATVPGQFEVELEDRAQQIAQLTVQP